MKDSPNPEARLVEVAVGLPVEGAFTYAVPGELSDVALPGARVLVPFGRRKVTGYVLGEGSPPDDAEIKEIIEVLDDIPAIPETLLRDLLWLAEYYVAPAGEVLKGALPAGMEKSSAAGVVITDEGRHALADETTSEADRDILGRVAAEPGIAPKKLEAAAGKGANSRLRRMLKRGWLLRQQKIREPSVNPRESKMVHAAAEPEKLEAAAEAMKKSAPARSRLLNYVISSGPVLLSELASRFKNAHGLVKKLEEAGLVSTSKVRVWRDPAMGEVGEYESRPPSPTAAQTEALSKILPALEKREFTPFLLHGVTGSGKTEVYLRAIEKVLELEREALVLVPEISLTPQLVGRFRARFGARVAVLHSALGKGERLDEWARVRRGMVKVAVGARSAVFAPFENLGLIVVDEEHDSGYKQEEKVRYNARDFALVRGRSNSAVVILGSATPSMETRHNALTGKYGLLKLPRRVRDRPMPEVKIIDMRTSPAGRCEFLSEELEREIEANLGAGKQTLLFLNRRGFAPFLMCTQCGHTFGCPQCSVSVTYHRWNRSLVCHLCDYTSPAPDTCPECKGINLKMFGAGTERVEDEISRLFPEARVARMDRDAAAKKGEVERILASLKDGSVDVVVGTRMIAKGHDYPGVTLVGVVLAETSLNFPDFRAAETTFSLLAQVSGRAGRGSSPGKVMVQTFNPGHYAIKYALAHDYEGFAAHEDKLRRDMAYPPHRKLAAIKLSGRDAVTVKEAAQKAGRLTRKIKGVEILGPAPAPWSKVKGRFRWQLAAKSRGSRECRAAVRYAAGEVEKMFKSVKVVVDVDPVSLL